MIGLSTSTKHSFLQMRILWQLTGHGQYLDYGTFQDDGLFVISYRSAGTGSLCLFNDSPSVGGGDRKNDSEAVLSSWDNGSKMRNR